MYVPRQMLRSVPLSVGPSGGPLRSIARPAPRLRPIDGPGPLPHVLARRDPELIRRAYPWLAAVTDRYFRAEVQGAEHMRDYASLYVSTHNGGMAMPDMWVLFVAFWRRFGLETPGYGMMHAIAFRIPGFGTLLGKVGAVPASSENARQVLRAGFPLLVCPGGDVDALKPFRMRHRIVFGARRGFIRLALRAEVPIVPVVSVGAHETLFVLNDGRGLARRLGLGHLRVKTAPFAFGLPFGITPGGLGAVPLPSKIVVRVLPPIALAEGPKAADDPAAVERCFEHVRTTMQRALDELAARRRWPVVG